MNQNGQNSLEGHLLTSDHLTIDLYCPKGHSQTLQKCPRLFIVASARNNRDVHAAQFIDLVEIDLREKSIAHERQSCSCRDHQTLLVKRRESL